MFRSKELRQFALLFLVITAAGVIVGLFIHPMAALLVFSTAAAFGILFYVFTKARYKDISKLSDQIDSVLHKGDYLSISDCEEGELSILQSEISKMTLRIREQNDALKREKQHLADSLANIAHQLRTPLTSANLILSLLKNNPEESERRALLRETKELFTRMDWLINSLLKLSRLDAGIVDFHREDMDVKNMIDLALRPLLIPMELHNITIKKNIPEKVTINGDLAWLSEALQNILKNSMESAGDDGKIEIHCEDTLLFTEITIHDNGSGFQTEDLHHIFDRFYRGKATGGSGYGIGLALCKTIIIRQGGTITAKNHPKGGAMFTIRFSK